MLAFLPPSLVSFSLGFLPVVSPNAPNVNPVFFSFLLSLGFLIVKPVLPSVVPKPPPELLPLGPFFLEDLLPKSDDPLKSSTFKFSSLTRDFDFFSDKALKDLSSVLSSLITPRAADFPKSIPPPPPLLNPLMFVPNPLPVLLVPNPSPP